MLPMAEAAMQTYVSSGAISNALAAGANVLGRRDQLTRPVGTHGEPSIRKRIRDSLESGSYFTATPKTSTAVHAPDYLANVSVGVVSTTDTSKKSMAGSKRPHTKKKRSYGRKANRVSQVRLTKRIVNDIAEVKNKDFPFSGGTLITPTVAWQFFTVSSLSVGTATDQRVGRKVRGIKLEWQLLFFPTTATLQVNGAVIRCIMFKDKDCQGALPAATAVFDTSATESLRNASLIKRFTFLHDIHHTASPRVNGTVTDPQILHTGACSLKGMPFHYNGTAGTIADLAGNNVMLGLSASANLSYTVQGMVRFWYSDM